MQVEIESIADRFGNYDHLKADIVANLNLIGPSYPRHFALRQRVDEKTVRLTLDGFIVYPPSDVMWRSKSITRSARMARPKNINAELLDQRVIIMMSKSELSLIERWMVENCLTSRGEAIRQLCRSGVEKNLKC